MFFFQAKNTFYLLYCKCFLAGFGILHKKTALSGFFLVFF